MIALVALVSLAGVVRVSLPVGPWYPFKAVALFGCIGCWTIGFLREHPFARFGPANQVTTARAVLVALAAALIGEPVVTLVARSAAAAGVLATALDGVDGWLARRSRMASEFGARFDMEIDALLIMVLSILVWRFGKAPYWILCSGLARYVFAGGGWLWPWLERALPRSRRRQAVCVVQTVALLVAILPAVRPPASTTVTAVALAALCYSFAVDVLWLWRARVRRF